MTEQTPKWNPARQKPPSRAPWYRPPIPYRFRDWAAF